MHAQDLACYASTWYPYYLCACHVYLVSFFLIVIYFLYNLDDYGDIWWKIDGMEFLMSSLVRWIRFAKHSEKYFTFKAKRHSSRGSCQIINKYHKTSWKLTCMLTLNRMTFLNVKLLCSLNGVLKKQLINLYTCYLFFLSESDIHTNIYTYGPFFMGVDEMCVKKMLHQDYRRTFSIAMNCYVLVSYFIYRKKWFSSITWNHFFLLQ